MTVHAVWQVSECQYCCYSAQTVQGAGPRQQATHLRTCLPLRADRWCSARRTPCQTSPADSWAGSREVWATGDARASVVAAAACLGGGHSGVKPPLPVPSPSLTHRHFNGASLVAFEFCSSTGKCAELAECPQCMCSNAQRCTCCGYYCGSEGPSAVDVCLCVQAYGNDQLGIELQSITPEDALHTYTPASRFIANKAERASCTSRKQVLMAAVIVVSPTCNNRSYHI
jgi:hypothetical protein